MALRDQSGHVRTHSPFIKMIPYTEVREVLELELAEQLWRRAIVGLSPVEAYYGPEVHERRPRDGEVLYTVDADSESSGGRSDRPLIGLDSLRRISPLVRRFCLVMFPGFRRAGLGSLMRDHALRLGFGEKLVVRLVETDVYTSNPLSLNWHQRHGRMRWTRREPAGFSLPGHPAIQRIWFSLTRDEWEVQKTQ